ncbi:hypothetical protein C8Q78DRAFT_1082523 [Trametes maxima]|nr:hypothetical protein C8Q78DRAFT_1082523 [Trametes maxima]
MCVPGSVVSSSSTQLIIDPGSSTSSSSAATTPATPGTTQSSFSTTTLSSTSQPHISPSGSKTISQTSSSESQAPTGGASAVPPRRSSTALIVSLSTTLSVITVAVIVFLCYWKRRARARKLLQLEAEEGPALVEPFTEHRTMVEKHEAIPSEECESDVTASSVAVFPTRHSMFSTAAEPLSRRSVLGQHGDNPHALDLRPVARPDPGTLKHATPSSGVGGSLTQRVEQSTALPPPSSTISSSSESPAYSAPPPALPPGAAAGVANTGRALPPLPQNVVVSSALGAGPDGHERLVELPWYLGERLLAFLANAPPSGRPESTVGPSETLPAYEPQR